MQSIEASPHRGKKANDAGWAGTQTSGITAYVLSASFIYLFYLDNGALL